MTYRLPSERPVPPRSPARRDRATAFAAALAYRRANILRLLHGDPLDPPPAGVVPDYARWAGDLLRHIDRAREAGPAEIAAAYRRFPHRLPYWRACLGATAHQRIRLRGIADGLRRP